MAGSASTRCWPWRALMAVLALAGFLAMHGVTAQHLPLDGGMTMSLAAGAADLRTDVAGSVANLTGVHPASVCAPPGCAPGTAEHGPAHGALAVCVPALLWLLLLILVTLALAAQRRTPASRRAAHGGQPRAATGPPRSRVPALAQLCLLQV